MDQVNQNNYVSGLLDKYDFAFLQQHWLRECQFHRTNNLKTSNWDFIAAYNVFTMECNEETRGRGYGGCLIIWKNSIKCKVAPISLDSRRICAVNVEWDNHSLILFNVYMPCDNGSNFV